MEDIKKHLQTKWLGKTIVYETAMSSTNTVAKEYGKKNVMERQEKSIHGTLFYTLKQTAGKGRRGRNWISPEGNCYFSVLLEPEIQAIHISRVTLVMAMAVAQAIQNVTGVETQIKWPNDIVVKGKKICGILTEGSSGSDGLEYVIVGVGINANQQLFTEEIRDMATSIRKETGEVVNREQLLAQCLNVFEGLYEQFAKTEDFSALQRDYNGRLVNYNREVRILDEEEWTGVALGIDETGALQVRTAEGEMRTILSGEVSVRGLYGYV